MTTGPDLDRDAIVLLCRAHGVSRLRVFGSATTDRFDPDHSDVDFLVDFIPDADDPFADYFGLKEDLELLLGRPIDLVMSNAVVNPYFAAAAFSSAKELYAA